MNLVTSQFYDRTPSLVSGPGAASRSTNPDPVRSQHPRGVAVPDTDTQRTLRLGVRPRPNTTLRSATVSQSRGPGGEATKDDDDPPRATSPPSWGHPPGDDADTPSPAVCTDATITGVPHVLVEVLDVDGTALSSVGTSTERCPVPTASRPGTWDTVPERKGITEIR